MDIASLVTIKMVNELNSRETGFLAMRWVLHLSIVSVVYIVAQAVTLPIDIDSQAESDIYIVEILWSL